MLWDFAGGRRGLHGIRRAAVRGRSPGTGQRALDARHAVTQYVKVATHFGHVGSERVDRATQTRPLPFDLTAQGCPLPTNHRHQYGQHRGHRTHRAEQHGNAVRHWRRAYCNGPADAREVRYVATDGMECPAFVDTLRVTRKKEATMPNTQRSYASRGHGQYTHNMATAASTSNLAVVLVDVSMGVLRPPAAPPQGPG